MKIYISKYILIRILGILVITICFGFSKKNKSKDFPALNSIVFKGNTFNSIAQGIDSILNNLIIKAELAYQEAIVSKIKWKQAEKVWLKAMELRIEYQEKEKKANEASKLAKKKARKAVIAAEKALKNKEIRLTQQFLDRAIELEKDLF